MAWSEEKMVWTRKEVKKKGIERVGSRKGQSDVQGCQEGARAPRERKGTGF